MNLRNFTSFCLALSVLTVLATPAIVRADSKGGPAGAAPAPPAPDLTPSGYPTTDPLYNDGEVKMGRQYADQIAKEAKFCQDKAVVARVDAIGAKVAAIADVTQVKAGYGNDKVVPYHYTYHVIESKEVNAFSLPGGFIYIYTGMLNLISSDDELAGVLGHETAHAAHHHVSTLAHEANKMSSEMLIAIVAAIAAHVPTGAIAAGGTAVNAAEEGYQNNVFSEAAERDADHTGMIFMQKAGYNPVGMMTMLERLGQDEKQSPDVDLGYLQDHPLTPERIDAARTELATLGVTLDAKTIREADNALPVLVSPPTTPPSKTLTVYVAGQPVVILAEKERPMAIAAAKELDKLLNNNLQAYTVKAIGPTLVAEGNPLLTVTSDDAALQTPPTTPEAVADQAHHKLAVILWSEVVNGVDGE